MSCGCGCNNCGDTPKMNGTEITVLSGLRTNGNEGSSNSNISNPSENNNKTNTYLVVGAAVIFAIAVGFTLKTSKGEE